MPITKKELKLTPIPLQVDGRIIIESINANPIEWQYKKTLEECVELMDAIMHYEKGDVVTEQVSAEIGDVFIQVAILTHLFSPPFIQECINKKLIAINNRNERIDKKFGPKGNIGFKP